MDGWSADLVVVGAGLAGLVAAAEAADADRSVLLLDQEGEQSLGGQAFWSLGGLFLVDSPEQRRMGVKDSLELARQDWFGSAQFDRPEDRWPRAWAEAYLQFAAGEKRAWLRQMGHRVFPVVGWAERGDGTASGHGNSVPRFHITWGTGPGVVAPFERRVREHVATGRIRLGFRHRVDELLVEGGAAVGVRGALLEPTSVDRGRPSSRTVVGHFEARGAAVVVTSGGIGGDHDLVRRNWPARLGTPPKRMVAGVPAHVDGRMLQITQDAGANVVNPDRMWHYVEGLRNWDPIWADHGIRILPGPSSLWLDAEGNRLPAPYFPGFDTLGTLRHLRATGHDYSWFVLTQRIIEKEFALSGSEQNPDLTGKDLKLLLSRVKKGAAGPVEAFKQHGEDFVVAETLEELVAGMNRVADDDVPPLEVSRVRTIVEARDREMDNTYSKDAQVTAIHGARTFLGDKLIRVARPHKLLDPAAGPLIAVRLNILSRKTLGGLETDLEGRCLRADGSAFPGLYAAGEVSGFGGGGMMGYNALEGTFLGGCLFSGRVAGRAAARAV
ncbi:FAD-binding dehydrogenase [Nocardioides sp. zg-579]|uniref:FAD-binding dehydrogenase n=1 Tax=Nocardioides marmotae TaxID=2663857 RepID=A0A6I3JDJ5_9ACTN|nr:FAD-binding dehydrogenase [Nocardioides marmotae]MCR6032516.1 FAD-binding dehydrogenase [Gordonia jinghuaiqii]MTB96165.1 FAD-binding dehydrogenase [Nocardioides marmotae]QKD99759.1 FAD-binding dehydrogenase [Nocardioides marmotae]